jgi:hypothetical protein
MIEPLVGDIELMAFFEQFSRGIVKEPHPFVGADAGMGTADEPCESQN